MIGPKAALVLCGLALATAATARGAEVDPFYLELERQARAAAGRGETFEAAKLYRTACFGMLDAPDRLAACLLRLGVAQAAAGERAELETTFRRLAELDERFGALARAPVTGEERRAFLSVVAAELAPEQWALAPGLRAEIASLQAEQAAEVEASGKRRRGAPAQTAEDPNATPAESEAIGGDEAPRGDFDAAPPAALLPVPAADDAAEEATIADARAIVASPAAGSAEVRGTLARLEPIALRRADEPELQELAARLAYRASLWAECARWYRRAGAPPIERPLDRFYFAVCLHEAGERDEARAMFAPIATALAPTPFVERYRNAILGSSSRP